MLEVKKIKICNLEIKNITNVNMLIILKIKKVIYREGLIGQKSIGRKLIFNIFHAYFEIRQSVKNNVRRR